MKTIQSKIILCTMSLAVTLCIILGIAGGISNYITALSVLQKNLQGTADLAAEYIEMELGNVQQLAKEVGCMEKISDPSVSIQEKRDIINKKAESYSYVSGNLLDLSGISLLDGIDYSDRDYFQASVKGESYISGPLITKLADKLSIIISAPVWKDGNEGSNVVGVVYFEPDIYLLSDLVSKIKLGDTGQAYIIDKTGLSIAYSDRERVGVERTIDDAKEDKALAKLAGIEENMIKLERGCDSYHYEGETWIQAYAPIKQTDGWSIGIYAKQKEFMGNARLSIIVAFFLTIFVIILGLFLAKRAAKRITLPIMLCVKRIELLSEGDLTTEVPFITTKDETAILAKSTKRLVNGLRYVVNDMSNVLNQMSQGNLNVESAKDYKGDFSPIHTATQKIIESLNQSMHEIRLAAEQVTNGSEQVATGSQELAQSSMEQACAAEELMASISEVAIQIRNTAESSNNANEQSDEAIKEVENCNKRMLNLVSAMTDIKQASAQIGHIIKDIEEIAAQTNLLSLNASIEAARAGEAGKGFAVVAAEVGSLAANSAEAAKITSSLIDTTKQAVEKGMEIAEDTAGALNSVIEYTLSVAKLIHGIDEATNTQNESVDQIRKAIEQVNDVVQNNSATSEESSASSEHLMSQAEALYSQVEKFQLK